MAYRRSITDANYGTLENNASDSWSDESEPLFDMVPIDSGLVTVPISTNLVVCYFVHGQV